MDIKSSISNVKKSILACYICGLHCSLVILSVFYMSHSIVMFMFRIYIHILVTILYIHESFVFIYFEN